MRRLTDFCKLVIFLVLTGFCEGKQAKNDYYEVSDSVLQICHSWAGIGFSENFTLTTLQCDFDVKQHKTR